MKPYQLRAQCKQLGASTSGTADQMRKRLLEVHRDGLAVVQMREAEEAAAEARHVGHRHE